jgi:hypothetical protein
MVKNDDLKQDMLIRRSEDFVYQSLKSIDHSVFHRERKLKIKRQSLINKALIKVFAYRHTYENFEMLQGVITQSAEELASLEIKEELKELEMHHLGNPKDSDADASKLIKIVLFLLRREIEKQLKIREMEKAYRDKTKDRWAVIIQVAQKIASIEAGEYTKDSDADISKLIRIILFLLREEIEKYVRKEKEKKTETDENWSDLEGIPLLEADLDDLAANIGEKALDEVVYSGIPLAAPLPEAKEDDKIGAWTDADLDYLAANLGDKALDEFMQADEPDENEDEDEDEDEDKAEEDISIRVISPESGELDDLAANMGDKSLDELIYSKSELPDEEEEEQVQEAGDQWMGWID